MSTIISMITELAGIRKLNFDFLWFLPIFIVLGCASLKPVVLGNNKITNQGIYSMSPPEGDWLYNSVRHTWHGRRSSTSRDILLVLCPGPHIIVISQAAYQPPVVGNKAASDEFSKSALSYLNDLLKNAEATSDYVIQSTTAFILNGNQAVSITAESDTKLVICDKESKLVTGTKRKIFRKFILIDGQKHHVYSGTGLANLKFIVIEYASSVENYKSELNHFDQMIQSFQFAD